MADQQTLSHVVLSAVTNSSGQLHDWLLCAAERPHA